MTHIYLERHEPDKNLHRFYQLFIIPGLFGDWSLVREWGRVGSSGTVRKQWFTDEAQATHAAEIIVTQKKNRGYAEKPMVSGNGA